MYSEEDSLVKGSPGYFLGGYFPSPFSSFLIEEIGELFTGLGDLAFCPMDCLRSVGGLWMGVGEHAEGGDIPPFLESSLSLCLVPMSNAALKLCSLL